MKKLILVIFFSSLMVSCSDSKTVNLRDSQNSNVDERGNPTPTPSPTASPSPNPSPNPAPEVPGDEDRSTPTPTPTPVLPSEKVARIFCESEPTPVRSFVTLRSDVWSDYQMPTITPYVGDRYVVAVKSPVPLQSDGERAFALVRALEDAMAEWKIYKSNVDLLSARADLEPISSFGVPSQAGAYAYKNLKLDITLTTANFKRTAYVYPNDSGAYVWENMKGTKMVLPFSANSSFSPLFTGADDYLRFDQNNGGRIGLVQKLYNFNTKKTLSLPTPASSKDSQLFAYVNNARTAVYWVEGSPNTTWKLRSMGLGASQKAVTLATLSAGKNSSIVLPMTFAEVNGSVILAYSEEELDQDKNRLPYLKEANLHLVKTSQGKATDEVVPYSSELKNLTKNSMDLSKGVLRGLFFEPISGRFYASGLPSGGLASFDPVNNSWAIHAMIASVFSCLNPQWGIEVPRD